MSKTVLILAPHTDDGELGCGGTIAKFVEEERDVHVVAFSDASTTLDDRWPKDQLRTEFDAASRALGLPEGNHRVLDFEVRRFPAHRQEILQAIIDLREELKPELVFVPSRNNFIPISCALLSQAHECGVP